MLVERTVSRWREGRWLSQGKKLSDYRSASGYVLLGEPGSGKSKAFEQETGIDGNGVGITARRFIRRSIDAHPEWRRGTLFIDGLDEVRAQGGDPREPLDALLCRLERLGNPSFRLSCRDESWLGQNDFREVSSAADGEDVCLLRLDPLTAQDALCILAGLGAPDPQGILQKAVGTGLEVFLENPLLLGILAKAQSSGAWPDGQLATFERACEELVRETNQEHLDARNGSPFPNEKVVLAAGRLCAILLLTGMSGWSRRSPGDDDCLAVNEAEGDQRLLQFALNTGLFVGTAETGRHPRHRRIAEFLAAKFLDRAIRERQLSSRRVLALMGGTDGTVMSDLRGTALWLAAWNPDSRRPLIESDPVGVAFNGDAGRFNREDTGLLLSGLEKHLKHQSRWAAPASLRALMSGPARDMLWEMLRSSNRSNARLRLVEVLLRGLVETSRSGSRLRVSGSSITAPKASKILLAVVRDGSWHWSVRERALDALIHLLAEEADGPSILIGLLCEIVEGRLPDNSGGELRGTLLTWLYPRHITAERVWDYAVRIGHVDERNRDHRPWSTVPRNSVRTFWTKHLMNESASEDVQTLLHTLVARAEQLIPPLAQDDAESVVLRLLARGLELFGEEMEVTELYGWFGLVKAHHERSELIPVHCRNLVLRHCHEPEQKEIYSWLRDHRDIQLALVQEGLKRHASLPRDRTLARQIGVKFLGGEQRSGFRTWCMDTAVGLAVTDPGPAIELAFWAVMEEREEWGRPLDNDEVVSAVQGTPLLEEWHEKRVAAEEESAARVARLHGSSRYREIRRLHKAYLESIRKELDAVEAGQVPSALLHELGRVYGYGIGQGGPNGPRRELRRHLASAGATEQDLAAAVISGFRSLVDRTDLPDLHQIVRLHVRGQTFHFAFPFLAGLAEDELAGEEPLQRLDEEGLRRALGFYLLSRLPTRRHPIPGVFSHSEDARPRWYHQALEIRPQTVADVFTAVHCARVRVKELPDQHLYDMAKNPEYERVAPLAVPRMFSPFPSICTEPQIEALREVLQAALTYMPRNELALLVRRRLRRKGMDVAQQAHWLAAGLFVEPELCFPKLFEFLSIGRNTKRIHHLVDFLVRDIEPLPSQDWPTAHLRALIEVVGRGLRSLWDTPRDRSAQFMTGERLGPGPKAHPLMNIWVQTVAARLDEESISALADLADDLTLEHWHGILLPARDEQAKNFQRSAHEVPAVRQIRDALGGGPPANSADLHALVIGELMNLARKIRDGNTDDWQQYWHSDPNDHQGRMVIEPKSEDPCRDALLSDLQLLLEPHEIDAQPEGHHAEDHRSDIIAVHGGHAIVVEVKRTHSRELWSAIEKQLIAKYLRDPKSGGYVIYLVLWFGPDHVRRAPPSGTRPESPGELRDRLVGLVPREHRHAVTVLVIDVSAPTGRCVGDAMS